MGDRRVKREGDDGSSGYDGSTLYACTLYEVHYMHNEAPLYN
jgi:hypothetical protein